MQQLETALADIDVSKVVKRSTLNLVAIELPVDEGKISFETHKSFVGKIYNYGDSRIFKKPENKRSEHLNISYFKYEPFIFDEESHSVVQRGSFSATSVIEAKCPECEKAFNFDRGQMMYNKRKSSFYCADCCTGKNVKELQVIGKVTPWVNAKVVEAMNAELAKDETVADPDVLPSMFGVFETGKAPGVWGPDTELTQLAVTRYAERGQEIRPYSMVGKIKNCPGLLGLIGLGSRISVGWIEEDVLAGNDTTLGYKRKFPKYRPPFTRKPAKNNILV